MKIKFIILMTLLICCVLGLNNLYSQPNIGGRPPSDSLKSFLKPIESITMQSVNIDFIDCYRDIKLEQNIPNPFNGTTEIKCIIPEKYGKNIQLVITNGTGLQELKKFDLEPVIENNIKVSASDFVTGAYIYGISINGVIVKSKKMMIIK